MFNSFNFMFCIFVHRTHMWCKTMSNKRESTFLVHMLIYRITWVKHRYNPPKLHTWRFYLRVSLNLRNSAVLYTLYWDLFFNSYDFSRLVLYYFLNTCSFLFCESVTIENVCYVCDICIYTWMCVICMYAQCAVVIRN